MGLLQKSEIMKFTKNRSCKYKPKLDTNKTVNRDFFEIFIAKKVCTTCSRTSYKTVPLPNLKAYLYNGNK